MRNIMENLLCAFAASNMSFYMSFCYLQHERDIKQFIDELGTNFYFILTNHYSYSDYLGGTN